VIAVCIVLLGLAMVGTILDIILWLQLSSNLATTKADKKSDKLLSGKDNLNQGRI